MEDSMKLNTMLKCGLSNQITYLHLSQYHHYFLAYTHPQEGIRRDVDTQPRKETKKGGKRAAFFVYATEGLENMVFISNAMSLATYFYGYMNFSLTKSATTLNNFMGTSFLLALFGGFISDTYLSRFKTSVIFGCIELVGYSVLAIQAHFHQLRPFPCKDVPLSQMNRCETADSSQVAIFFTGLYLVAFGTSGVKAALPSLGVDQFDERDPKEAAFLSSFFRFLFSITIGLIFGVTFIVWIGDNQGWDWSFGVCTVAILFAVLFLCMGKSVYRNNVPKGSPILRILQVFVAAIRNRNLPTPEIAEELHEIHDKEAGIDTEILQRTNQFRFLETAAIVRTIQSTSTSYTHGPWSLCTVTQVEETKILLRMLPLILSTVFMTTCLAQFHTFSIQQSTTMDRHILGFEVPGASIPVIPLLFMFILIPVYDHIFVPLARKVTGIPTGIRRLQRIGVGLVLSAISMAVAAVMETRRKNVAVENNMIDSIEPLPMSVLWLGFQYAIFGAAEMFTFVGLLEFFYAESSSGMKSLSTAISWCSMALGYFLSSVMVEVVNKASGGWLASNNLNRDKLDCFYWLLSIISIVNFGVYLMCASWYRYKVVEMKQVGTSSASDAEEKIEKTAIMEVQFQRLDSMSKHQMHEQFGQMYQQSGQLYELNQNMYEQQQQQQMMQSQRLEDIIHINTYQSDASNLDNTTYPEYQYRSRNSNHWSSFF